LLDRRVFRRNRNRLLGEASEVVAPALRGVAAILARRRPSPAATWRRGLIVGHAHIGDVLYRTCSLEQLRALLPDCRWSYLCAPGAAELLDGNPALAEVLPLMSGDDSWRLAPGGFAELRRRDFDVALCTNTLRHYPDFALATALGVPNRVGFAHKGLSGLLTHRAPLPFPSPFPAYFRAMVADLGSVRGDWPLRPRVHLTADDREAAACQWAELGPGRLPVVACVLTTRQPLGNWPASHLLDALRLARREAEFELVLCGGAADAAALHAAASVLGFPARVMAGALGLRAFTAFLARCVALVTLDTGPRHLGNAAGVPVLFARNLSHSRIEAGPYAPTEIDLAPAVEYLTEPEIAATVAHIPPLVTARSLLGVLARDQRAG
jgi:ADP-heptose:LPS heptosyltransferase